VRQTATLAVAP